jgi:hypothetical protein
MDLGWGNMKAQRFFFGLTLLNLLLVAAVVFRANSAPPEPIAPVLRARALEIVDERGQVRAMIKVFPADPNVKMPDGTSGYPETVLLRLINSKGAPNVKISAMEDGSGISLGGESNPTHVQVLARGTNTLLKLVNQDGREQVIKPQ